MKCLLLFSTTVECWDASHRPSGAMSFQEWRAVTDIRGPSGTRPRTDGVQHVRLIMMEQDTPGIAGAPVGGWTHAASVVPPGSVWERL